MIFSVATYRVYVKICKLITLKLKTVLIMEVVCYEFVILHFVDVKLMQLKRQTVVTLLYKQPYTQHY